MGPENIQKLFRKKLPQSSQVFLGSNTKPNNCLGGIFCKIEPYYKGVLLFIDSIQVKPGYRNQGVAKALLKKVYEMAKKDGILAIHFLTDNRKKFPKKWYKKNGI